ncbi:uncharacterized protein At2g24330-like [Zingiber officinale]|uniref:Lunapark zinc ribbon domain-containing protein n=1 Tax=Zingiber officinale TaxID=94328 RepID=A0A8J5CED7_ZINOF|nr:uncharacterized protein At2g24330-like [Zingiber officinale]KAG6472802.1 hypothetical protein ZIOFF_070280 [Zingiber officinale]
MAEETASSPVGDPDAVLTPKRQQRRGFVSRLLRGIFAADDDIQKKLEHISKEEASIHSRLKRRAQSSRKIARNVIFLSVIIEVVAVSYAIASTRSKDLDWKMRATCVLPMFIIPVLSTVVYSSLLRLTRLLDKKDQKTLERLRAERKETIDELKEKTNYYSTQQLIQRYDLDPAAKAAAATVLASKLGADSGLKLQVGEEISDPSGKSHDVELVQSSGLRNRKPSRAVASSSGSTTSELIDDAFNDFATTNQGISSPNHRVVEHFKGSVFSEGSWLSRIAALLVGEDPTQCYALICAHCHMHNGLAKKEDFSYITYYCPHCHGLNGQKHQEEHEMSIDSGKDTPISSPYSDNTYQSENNTSLTTKDAVSSSLAMVKESPEDVDEDVRNNATGIAGLVNEKIDEKESVKTAT